MNRWSRSLSLSLRKKGKKNGKDGAVGRLHRGFFPALQRFLTRSVPCLRRHCRLSLSSTENKHSQGNRKRGAENKLRRR